VSAKALRFAELGSRVISICIHDSRSPPSFGPSAVRLPSLSRTTAITGWMTSRTPPSLSLIAAIVESTRNGMSSLTISTIVCGDDQPSLAIAGL